VFYKVFATLIFALKKLSGSRVPTQSRFTTAHLGNYNHVYSIKKPSYKAMYSLVVEVTGFLPNFLIRHDVLRAGLLQIEVRVRVEGKKHRQALRIALTLALALRN
jgi:hypothetical protein